MDIHPPKVIIASHRLPIKVVNGQVLPSDGGLVSTLNDAGLSQEALWVGHLGNDVGRDFMKKVAPFKPHEKYLPIQCDPEDHSDFYNGFCNQTIWPGFHDRMDLVESDEKFWRAYKVVNKTFCDAIIENSDENTPIWIHDYHLMLLPKMIKRLQPRRKVGFFLHIPWPRFKVARQIPYLHEVAEALMHADGLSFQTPAYLMNFQKYVMEMELCNNSDHKASLQKRLHCTPVGIDADRFKPSENEKTRSKENRTFRIIGVDRLDYSKGIDFKLLAFHDFLEVNPHMRGLISLNQLLIPTRDDIPAYQEYRQEVIQLSNYINRKFRQQDWQPVHLKIGHMSPSELKRFYQQGDVCFISSQADGMNLVSMEYLSAQDPSSPGALLMSDRAGAANFLTHAIQFEGSDLSSAVRGLFTVLRMPLSERRERWEADMEWVRRNSAKAYSLQNLEFLGLNISRGDQSEGAFTSAV